jgi:hypothetical protein
MRDIWQWVEARLGGSVAADTEIVSAFEEVRFPIILAPEGLATPAGIEPQQPPPSLDENGIAWDAGL